VAAAIAATLACLGADAAGAATAEITAGEVRGCHEIIAYFDVPAGPVRERVPSNYTLVEESPGQAKLLARGTSCESVNVRGRDVPTRMAQLSAVIESPDGDNCMSAGMRDYGFEQLPGDLVKFCAWYPFFMATDNREFAKWLKADGTRSYPVHYTTAFESRFEPGPLPGQHDFHFAIGGSVPSPFELVGAGLEREGEVPLRIIYWRNDGARMVKLFAEPATKLGHAAGEVRTAPGTDFAQMLGGTTARFASPFGLNLIVVGPLFKEIRSP
jgi:hypothetical protein